MATTAATSKDTVRLLVQSIINRLENQKSIEFAPRLRQVLQDEVCQLIMPHIRTEEDLREQALTRMGARTELLQSSDFAESDQYKAARAVIRKTFGDDVLNGFYFQKPLKSVAGMIVQFFMRSTFVDDVFETDEDLERKIVDIVKKFNPAELH